MWQIHIFILLLSFSCSLSTEISDCIASLHKECPNITRIDHLKCLMSKQITNIKKLLEVFKESQQHIVDIRHEMKQEFGYSEVALDQVLDGDYSFLLKMPTDSTESCSASASLNGTGVLVNPAAMARSTGPIKSCSDLPYTDQALLQLPDQAPPFWVLCVQKHKGTGNGWIVIQQRVLGKVSFFRPWMDYREGFGILDNDFWLGLEHIHRLTTVHHCELLVEMTDYQGNYKFARYTRFEIAGEDEEYAVRQLGSYSGTAGDSLRSHVGMKFSTYDNDNGRNEARNCAIEYSSGWWFDNCFQKYGSPNELLELGKVSPGTYCTRQYDECYRKRCRLQSPNYPGMYPRNVTCYWTIRQKVVPTCKHAMVAISQENKHKALVKRSIASFNKTSRAVRAWSDCTGERDHLIFYDGSSTNDPVLAKYCGGDWLPKVVSRGHEMLIAFHSSPFSAPLQSGQSNRGFELDVDILFADSDSYDFAQGNKCEFHINASNPDEVLFSRRGRMGHLLSPRHTLPPNTTCTYYFHGILTDLVWISFTNYHLQILQPTSSSDNSTIGKNDAPLPWINRLRIWDSSGTYVPIKTTSPASITTSSTTSAQTSPSSLSSVTFGSNSNAAGVATPGLTGTSTTALYQQMMNRSVGTYYGTLNHGKSLRINIDNVWNPVDQYIYGPTVNSIFNQPQVPHHSTQQHHSGVSVGGSGLTSEKGLVYGGAQQDKPSKGKGSKDGSRHGKDNEVFKEHGGSGRRDKSSRSNRRMVAEFYDNESPKLCDHVSLESKGNLMRPCTPLESYVSTGNDLKIEFHTMTGTSLFPSSFGINYEFIDTELGGEPYLGQKDEEVPLLCSRVFRKRKGDFQSPRNVFLHGRGGAKNISCLYRFEASVGERVRIELYNVSFGESDSCITESDGHTGRARCASSESNLDGRVGELRLFDVPHKDVKIPLGCFCDNTSSSYNSPLTFISNSRTLELTFVVTKLNISEDFADVYFHASYDFIRVPECRKRLFLRGSGGEDEVSYPLRSHEASCDGLPWYIEAQQQDRSLFIQTWGSSLSLDPIQDEFSKCNTRNRLMVYSGKPLKLIQVICPSAPSSRATPLHIFSEDWLSNQPFLSSDRSVSMVLEPIHKEAGSIAFSWMEIQHTKASLIQQLEQHTNTTGNDTLMEFGLFPRESECEHQCPEINACIASDLWCDGHPNCPSGFDESEQECGSRLMELPGGMFAAFGCLAAALCACLIFCVLAMVKKRRKSNEKLKTAPSSLNGTLSKKDYKKEPLFFDPDS